MQYVYEAWRKKRVDDLEKALLEYHTLVENLNYHLVETGDVKMAISIGQQLIAKINTMIEAGK